MNIFMQVVFELAVKSTSQVVFEPVLEEVPAALAFPPSWKEIPS
jgi:hypothetical protein